MQNCEDEIDQLFGDDDDEVGDSVQTPTAIINDSRPVSCGVLSFHTGTEESMLVTVERICPRGDMTDILKKIDDFCNRRHWMMHIGDQKLLILEKAINDAQLLADTSAIICVEIGSYCGYSALGIARRLRQNDKLICIECDPNCVKWTKRLLAHADISERVNILQGKIDDQSLNALQVMLHGEAIHLLFIDHDKATYLKDLKLIEDWNLLRHGTIVVADNVLSFGAPLDEYLSHVRNPIGPYRSSTLHMSTVEYANSSDFADRIDESLIDGVEVSVFA